MVARVFRQAFAIGSNRSFVVPALLVSVAMTLVVKTFSPETVPRSNAFDWLIFVTVIERLVVTVAVGVLSRWPYASLASLTRSEFFLAPPDSEPAH
jgi:hypothetical protein